MECIGQFGLGLGIIPRAQLIVNSISPYTALRVQEFLVLSSTTLAGKRMWITFPSQRDRSPLRNCMTHLSLERNPPQQSLEVIYECLTHFSITSVAACRG